MILLIVSAKVEIIFWGRGGLMILRIVSAKVAIIFGGGENSLSLIYLSDDAQINCIFKNFSNS
jgi:hypothetical protein